MKVVETKPLTKMKPHGSLKMVDWSNDIHQILLANLLEYGDEVISIFTSPK